MTIGTPRTRRGLLATCACVALTCPAMADDAQTEDTTDAVVLDTIEVTAQHRSQDALDVPISMEVMDRYEIEDKDLDDLSEALNTVPNVVQRSDNGGVGFSTITIRGVGNQGGGMAGGDQAIGMYTDDVYIGAQVGMNPPLYDVERIEVLRGPQGTLYGRNAMGGAINIVTAEPDPETYASAEAMYGSYNRYSFTGVANGEIGTWGDTTVSARLSAQQSGRGTTVENTVGDDMGDYSSSSVRAQTRVTSSLYDIVFRADYTDQEAGVFAYDDFDTATDRKVAVGEAFDYELQNFGASLNAKVALGDLTLHSISAWRGTHSELDGGDFDDASDNLQQGSVWNQRQLSQEFRLTSPDDTRLRWTTGVYFFHNEEFEKNYYGHRLGTDALWGYYSNGEKEESRSHTTTDSQAVFGDATYGVTNWLDVTVGGRLTHDTKETEYSHVSELGMAPTQTLHDSLETLNFSPKVTLAVMPTDNVRVYGSVTRGYKSGGFNRQFVPATNLGFDPETMWSYEVGTKMRLFDERVALNAALFYTDWHDQQVTVWKGTYNDISNVPHSQSYGAEVDVAARVTETVTLGGSFGWTEATFLDFPNPDDGITSGDGFRQPNAPRFTYAVNAQYLGRLRDVIPVKTDLDLRARADYTYRSSYYYDVTNQLEEPGYGLLDLSASIIGDGWELEGFIENVTDQDYRVQAIQYYSDLAIAGDPRTFGMRVKLEF